MKKIFSILFASLFLYYHSRAQVSSVGIRNEFNSISHYGSRQTGFEGLQTYSTHITLDTTGKIYNRQDLKETPFKKE